jgi:hypothetical protein
VLGAESRGRGRPLGAAAGAARMSGRGNKYHAVLAPCTQGGVAHVHRSRKERDRCFVLHHRQGAGEIQHLARETRWPLVCNGVRIGLFTDDFSYDERQADGTWRFVVEDCKSPATRKIRDYPLRKKLLLACFGHQLRET